MNLLQARRAAMQLAEAGNAVLLTSGSGIGKSQTVYSIFEELRDRDAPKGITWGFSQIFAATQTPPDLIGFQFKGEREFPTGKLDDAGKAVTAKVTITDPSVPLWMISTEGKPAWMYDRFFLLIDEYGQGEADVKRAVAEIFLNGGTAPWYLPPGSIRMACSNQGARYGVTKDFDFSIARRTELKIDGDVELWLRYANQPYRYQGKDWQTLPITKAWAASNPAILFEQEPKEQGPWCNPRALCAADRYLQVAWQHAPKQTVEPEMMEVLAGTIGMPATQSLVSHLQFKLDLPSYEDVVADPMGTPVPTKPDMLMLMVYELAGYTKPDRLAECIQYVQRLPKDMGVTYISSLLARDYKNMISHPAMQAWTNKNAALISIIASLSRH